jgi:2-dehydro-3-deoxyphosphogluconate aldolase / (4S)-4-hydroxy-2-oxoglutarate aldolase
VGLAEVLRAHRLLGIVRGRDPQASLRTVVTLVEQGVEVVEVSLTTADALGVLAGARRELGPAAHLGAGTVLAAQDVRHAADAGASFMVTPALCDAIESARSAGLPVLAGAFTATEVVGANARGAAGVKLFPASLGGPGYLRALRDPFPRTAFVPVGGVDAVAAEQYLKAGAAAVGVGSPLVGDAADGGDIEGLRRRARAFLAAVTRGGPE